MSAKSFGTLFERLGRRAGAPSVRAEALGGQSSSRGKSRPICR
jgi:hypothetical protein